MITIIVQKFLLTEMAHISSPFLVAVFFGSEWAPGYLGPLPELCCRTLSLLCPLLSLQRCLLHLLQTRVLLHVDLDATRCGCRHTHSVREGEREIELRVRYSSSRCVFAVMLLVLGFFSITSHCINRSLHHIVVKGTWHCKFPICCTTCMS